MGDWLAPDLLFDGDTLRPGMALRQAQVQVALAPYYFGTAK